MCRCHRLFRSRRIEWPWAVASSCVQQPTSRVISAVCAIRRWSSWRSTVASTSTARTRSQSRIGFQQGNSLSPTRIMRPIVSSSSSTIAVGLDRSVDPCDDLYEQLPTVASTLVVPARSLGTGPTLRKARSQ
ncbi:uncharacterized protein LOC119400145 isoform X2 [Rhipicephalus sanguineus]|uniref:uncharacterized protein LOC119400145 isoform X2 n=1 Tax=Rhipicephalus sanguineus TaxID=34632 RepID=UPI0020C2AEA3|nr:uncharacterized protein LOC119400145 isoform X2 [Rhipicephalus sanguineus]